MKRRLTAISLHFILPPSYFILPLSTVCPFLLQWRFRRGEGQTVG